jgi:voltage-gated potassium channel
MKLKSNIPFSHVIPHIVLMGFLLFTIFFVMVFPLPYQKILYQICFSGILITAFFCLDKYYRRYLRWLIGLTVVMIWFYIFTDNFFANSASKSLIICSYITIAGSMVNQAAMSKTIDRIVILESVNGYLMVGMFFSIIVALIMLFNPGAYHFKAHIKNSDELLINFSEYLYYGFNAFTTITYGDVRPVSPIAKSLSMAMGFVSQMYVAVIIAMLVGKYVGQRKI